MSTEKNSDKNVGKNFITSILKIIPSQCGIYKMLDSSGKIIYIGKAKNLKNRVSSYTSNQLMPRTSFMVSQIYNVEWLITKDEQDALLLESDLVKHFKPKYNILLKDDKTFPFIKIDTDHRYPRIFKIRSKQVTPNSNTFGPFASSADVDSNIKVIQNVFQIRSCSDNTFINRKQACILYQIKRCSAPCVQKLSEDNYQESVIQALDFLKGDTQELKNYLAQAMLECSKNNHFEQAIIFRERIKSLNRISASQSIVLDNAETADFIALIEHNGNYLFKIFMFKNGHNYGSLDFPSTMKIEENLSDVLQIFIARFYTNKELPQKIYINIPLNKDEIYTIRNFFKKMNNKVVEIGNPKSAKTIDIMDIIIKNAFDFLNKYEASNHKWEKQFSELQNYFAMQNKIEKIEIYDNSHLYGTFSLGAMVSARVYGFEKKEYRVFKLKDTKISTKDDYGILKETLLRRFTRMLKENQEMPQLVLLDGGKGQLEIAKSVLHSLAVNSIKLVAVAKGENRNAGEETLFIDSGEVLKPDKFSAILHFIQMLRNEAHRYAIKNVTKGKLKSIRISELDNIPGIGGKRKKDLLNYFGSIEKIKTVSVNELKKVQGISEEVAKNIFNWFH